MLAGLLEHYRDQDDVVVLALPRGGVPVAYEVAMALGAGLDVFLVRKLGVPQRPELAMGAIASAGVVVVNDDVVRGFNLSPEVIAQVAEEENRELLRRERVYREARPPVEVAGKTVIVVDDGLATGASMLAAIRALRRLRPARLVVAVPAAPKSTCAELADEVDEAVCATTPAPFFAVGASYWDFDQTTDEEVRDLLRAASVSRPPVGGEGANEVPVIRTVAVPVEHGAPSDDALFDLVGDARFVLIGEASHGTHEFYAARARMSQRLIEQRGFCAVAAEADWPDAYRVNRYVRGRGDDSTGEEALRGFERFPTWMWRNADVLDFVGWLREHNDRADDGQNYGRAAAFGAGESCEQQVVEQLVDLQRRAVDYARRDGLIAQDELFYAEQNARLVQAAERYYRTALRSRVASWNLRDQHMVQTLNALADHLTSQRGEPAKIVVWAHNSHLGDARATELSARGELNVGQLVREQHPGDCRLIGFTTYTGTVTAAGNWGAPAERKQVRPALAGSVEELFHEVGQKEFMLTFATAPRAAEALRAARLERAIGVIYRPQTERQSHYYRARLADQFDAVIHIDETRALEPLERTARWDAGELPETYPSAV